jgi:hypothetical protein
MHGSALVAATSGAVPFMCSAPNAAGMHGSALEAPGVKVKEPKGRVSAATRCSAAH